MLHTYYSNTSNNSNNNRNSYHRHPNKVGMKKKIDGKNENSDYRSSSPSFISASFSSTGSGSSQVEKTPGRAIAELLKGQKSIDIL